MTTGEHQWTPCQWIVGHVEHAGKGYHETLAASVIMGELETCVACVHDLRGHYRRSWSP